MLNVGLTGGIACGKSTVAGMFREKGAFLIDFDDLVRRLQQPRQPVWQAIVAAFGRSILNRDDTINRAALASLVFQTPEKRMILNTIVHPAVFAQWSRMLDALRTENAHPIVISDIPLLIEAGKQNSVDLVILVHIPPEEQLNRLIRRDGFSRKEAVERLGSQLPIDDKIAYAHVVIDNSGPPERTRETVEQVWTDLLARAEKKRLAPS